MVSMFFAGLFVTVAVAVFALGHILLLQAIFIGPTEEQTASRPHARVSDTSGAMTA